MNRKNRARFQPGFEALESRELRTVGLSSVLTPSLASVALAANAATATTLGDATSNTGTPALNKVATSVNEQSVIQSLQPDHQIPALSSSSGSAHTLYLNFAGDSRSDWYYIDYGATTQHHYKNVKMSAFDTDGDATTFSDTEKAEMTEIWARVAEAYAPYDINVTTVYPASLAHGATLTVDIGKSNGWLGTTNTGISSIGSFTSSAPNVVFDFCDQVGSFLGGPSGPLDTANNPNFVMQVANTAIHESGHGFGLLHDRTYNADHSVANQYDPGNSTWTPFMGNNLTAVRHTWALGITGWNGNTPVLQWDPTTLANALGYRTDDFGDDIAHAAPLTVSLQGMATVKGVIGYHPPTFIFQQPDVDVFAFNAKAGSVTVEADVLAYKNGAILDARVELWSAQGMLGATTAPIGNNAVLTMNVPAGKYFVKVMSGGGLTDVGQYTLTVHGPSALSARPVGVGRLLTVQAFANSAGAALAGATPMVAANQNVIASEVGLTTSGEQLTQAELTDLASLVSQSKTTSPARLRATVAGVTATTAASKATLDALFASALPTVFTAV
jgi:hypothetical protein